MDMSIYVFIGMGAAGLFVFALQIAQIIFRVGGEEELSDEADDTATGLAGFLPEDLLRIKVLIAAVLTTLFVIVAMTQMRNAGEFSLVLIVLGTVLTVVTFYVSFAVPNKIVSFLIERKLEKMNLQLVDALNTLSLTMRAGRNLEGALPIVAEQTPSPLGREFGVAVQQIHTGGLTVYEALERLRKRVPIKDMDIFVSTVQVLGETGGPQAEIFEKNAQLIRERFRIKQRVAALTAEGRFTAFFLAWTPAFVFIVNYLIDPENVGRFLVHPVGLLIVTAIGVSDYIGYRIIHKLVSFEI